MDPVELEYRALRLATAWHGEKLQVRKYTGEPYILHPIAVAQIVRTVPEHTPEMVAAAYLHDVVEDTNARFLDVELNFGQDVYQLVYWLTDISQPEHGNRKIRKQMDREHIWKAPREAQIIKLADIIHNTESIMRYDRNFWKVYATEKDILLSGMDKTLPLWQQAYNNISTTWVT